MDPCGALKLHGKQNLLAKAIDFILDSRELPLHGKQELLANISRVLTTAIVW